MKRYIIVGLSIFTSLLTFAQTEFDAYKVVQTDINGTARYMGMAGAFGALGGDASSIKDNPAGLGIYRRSELTGTLNNMSLNSTSTWNSNKGYGDMYKMNLNNFSLTLANPTWLSENKMSGLQSSNWNFSYNRLKNFDRMTSVSTSNSNSSFADYLAYFSYEYRPGDFDGKIRDLFRNEYLSPLSIYGFEGYLMDYNGLDSQGKGTWKSAFSEKNSSNFRQTETGYLDQYSLAWAGNYDNSFFLGASLNYQTYRYTSARHYGETYLTQGSFNLGDTVSSNGNGINLKIGGIFSASDNIRLGFALETPTVYRISENYKSTLGYTMPNDSSFVVVGAEYENSFKVRSPFKYNASIAYLFGKKGLLSFEYDYIDYASIRYMNSDYDQNFSPVNDGMKETLRNSRTIKLGGEYKLTDKFSIRGGYANTSSGTLPNAEKYMSVYTKRVDTEYYLDNSLDYFTAGLGYRDSDWYLDFAYMKKILHQTFYPYRSSQLAVKATGAKVETITNNLVLTLGLRF
ncbi:MAG: hypothetical protein RIS29_3050 [Bacteroidota bacterium]|jgi:hypothetical protein